MAWRRELSDKLLVYLRFSVRAVWVLNGLLLASLSVYVVGRFCWYLARYLDRTLFLSPW